MSHVIQGCPRTHGIRIKRYDALVKFIAETNRRRGKKVVIEPRVETEGLRKPDIIIKDGAQATVLDIQITNNDGNLLKTFNNNKINYYSQNSELKDKIMSAYNVSEVDFTAITVHFKGFMSLCI